MLISPADRLPRRGVTLIELMVTIVIGGIALSLVAAVSLRQQRVVGDMADGAVLSSQLAEAAAILPLDLGSLASGAGDIREARDTSIEARTTIASAVICDTIGSAVILPPLGAGAGTYANVPTPIAVGDTAWVLSTTDSAEVWAPHRVATSNSTSPGACAGTAPLLSDSARTLPRLVLGLEGTWADAPVGMPVRVTRPVRYSLYRGSDGLWYLGQRDWNTTTLRFNTVQPVSGPFLPPASKGLVFQYVDAVGQAIASPVADTRSVSMIRVDLRAQTRDVVRALSSANVSGKRGDSVAVWVLLRNRR